jgi:galactosyl transferase GMA12/MNN10 family
MNPHTPLETFLPPDSVAELSDVHLLMASNWDGLNSGAFALRVHPWSVSLLSIVLAYPVYRAEQLKKDRFRDQSAFQWLIQAQDSPLVKTPGAGKDNFAEVPMRWFNSLPINNAFAKDKDWIFNHNLTDELFDKGTDEVYDDGNDLTVQPWKIKQGDMVVHCAGSSAVRESWMSGWLRRAEAYLPEWSNATTQEDLKVEATAFWRDRANQKIWRQGGKEETEEGEQETAPSSRNPNAKLLSFRKKKGSKPGRKWG